VLIDRAEERRVVEAVLDDAVRGAPRLLVLLGEPGTGTSSLLAQAEAVASDCGARTVAVSAVEPDLAIAGAACSLVVGALPDVVRGLDGATAECLRATARGVVDGRLPGAVLELLARAAEERPLVLLGDDVQWWDGESLEAVVFAVRRLSFDAVAVVLSGRTSAGDRPALHGAHRVVVGPLGRDAAVAVVREQHPEIVVEVAQQLYDRLGGNPSTLLDVAAQLPDRVRTGTVTLPDPVPVGGSVSARWARVIDALPERTRTALAVLAAEATQDELLVQQAWDLLGCSGEDLVAAEACQVVALGPSGWRFPAPVVGAAVFAALKPPERRAAHAALARALAGAGREALYARHLVESQVGPDEQVADELAALSSTFMTAGSTTSAAAAAEQAARFTPPGPVHVERLLGAAQLALLCGDDERAADLAQQGLRLGPDVLSAASFQRVVGSAVGRQRDSRRGVELLRGAAEALDDDERRAALVDALGFVKMWNDPQAAARLVDELGDLASLAPWMKLDVGSCLAAAGDWQRAVPLLEGGLRDVDPGAPGVPESVVDAWADAAGIVGLDEHADRYRATAARLVDSGSPLRSARGWAMAVEMAYADGRWAEAERICQQLRSLDEALGRFPRFSAGTELRIAARRGDRDAFEHVEQALRRTAADAGLVLLTDNAIGLRAMLHASLGDPSAAEPLLRQTVDGAPPGMLVTTVFPSAAVTLVALLARDGRVDEARALAGPLVDRLVAQPAPLAQAYAERLLAHTCTDDEAHEHFLAASGWNRRGMHAFEAARTHWEHGQWLRRHRRRSDAIEQLVAAVEAFERMGCGAWVERCRHELRAAGVDTARTDPYSALTVLTAQERQVAEAAAEGLTNAAIARRMYLSPKTVELHLTHVYRKLGIGGRGELVDLRAADTAASR
jgi:DNA-binding CsgD family transcriptional regulator/tetratricopeptide (TPR) repeat protein